MSKKILSVFGTRPEAIKMAPLVKELSKSKQFKTKICVTAQHREMLDQVLDFFEIEPDFDMDLMKENQTLNGLWADILVNIKYILDDFKPDWVLVHGDTATSTAVALASYFSECKVGHVEAGLRTWDKWAPYPEEMNRQITGRIADLHFAPTKDAKSNLKREGVDSDNIVVTGNTVIDALMYSIEKINRGYSNEKIKEIERGIDFSKNIILVTGHRRENFGQGFINICNALTEIAQANNENEIVYPVHLNPNVQEPVNRLLQGIPNIHLVDPLAYPSFVWLMNKSKIIITDSGGIQEEAPSLGKPVLVMRETTERPEALKAGTVKLVGTSKEKIVDETLKLLNDDKKYEEMSVSNNPFGDGSASSKIVTALN
ncbi:non-hydrolyzing UDP-N-acetylglucosamine 2-epimerase [Halalkalibaculum sp. DA3122]|uniref:non-hydrolyzing UDP-N-acetylglucosamine 2-epimerase n=1 Tax=Halalkalibaculum sp. DA3122 TaxID=3373607 RepID=UPI00375533A8